MTNPPSHSPHLHYSYTATDKADPNRFESHCHNEYELLYICRGDGKFVVEGAEYPMSPHTLMLIRPHEYHYVRPNQDSFYERYVINFGRNLLPHVVADLAFLHETAKKRHGIFFTEEQVTRQIHQEFLALENICRQLDTHENAADAQREVLITTLTRVLLLLSFSAPTDEIQYEENIITRITEYLDSHATEPFSLDQLSQHFFISKYYLCHAFRQQNGTSILAYLTTKRILLAQQLLKSGEPATSVAQMTGFQNYSSFYRAYLKQTGHAPSELKK